MSRQLITILSIAGSDCSGGAGIQGDIRAASYCGVFAATAVTAVTIQNSEGVSEVIPSPSASVISQIKAVFRDKRPDAVKIGMLATEETAEAVGHFIKKNASGIPVVTDPVATASAGGDLGCSARSLKEIYLNLIFPCSSLITPNLREAAFFLADDSSPEPSSETSQLDCDEYMEDAALRMLYAGGCAAALIKGGHSDSDIISDVLAVRNHKAVEKGNATRLADVYRQSAPKIDCRNLHGTGCTYSSMLAAELAKGKSMPEAFRICFHAMKEIIAASTGYSFGISGYGPLNMSNYKTK